MERVVKLLLRVEPWKGFVDREVLVDEAVEPPVIVRLDGVGFGRRAPRGCDKPRCIEVHKAIVNGAEEVCRLYGCQFYYVVSDEANLFFFRGLPYGGRIVKLVSVLAGELSARVTGSLSVPLAFDARVVVVSREEAVDYLLWRMRIGFNNYIAQVYHSLYWDKATPSLSVMVEKLERKGYKLNDEELWRLVGTCGYTKTIVKDAVNKLTRAKIRVWRRVWKLSSDPYTCIEALRRTLAE